MNLSSDAYNAANQHDELERRALQMGFRMVDAGGAGDCFFLSLRMMLEGDEVWGGLSHVQLRARVYAFIVTHWELYDLSNFIDKERFTPRGEAYEVSVDQALQELGTVGKDADSCCLRATAELLARPVVAVRAVGIDNAFDPSFLHLAADEPRNIGPPLHFAYLAGQRGHYMAMMPLTNTPPIPAALTAPMDVDMQIDSPEVVAQTLAPVVAPIAVPIAAPTRLRSSGQSILEADIQESIQRVFKTQLAESRTWAREALDEIRRYGVAGEHAQVRLWCFLRDIRRARREQILGCSEIKIFRGRETGLLDLAIDPLGYSMRAHADFNLVGFAQLDAKGTPVWLDHDMRPAVAQTRCDVHWRLYVRELACDTPGRKQLVLQALDWYEVCYKDRASRTRLLRAEFSKLAGDAPASLKYVGFAVDTSPAGRILHDLGSAFGFFSTFARLLDLVARHSLFVEIPTWAVSRWKTVVRCTSLELRSRRDLQTAERAFISAIHGVSLNIAPGGFHSLGVCRVPAVPGVSPLLVPDGRLGPVPAALVAFVTVHFASMRLFWANVMRRPSAMSNPAYDAALREALNLVIVGQGYTLSVLVGKDITQEGINSRNADLAGFYAPLVGPGPAAGLLARSVAMRWTSEVRALARREDWRSLTGGFIDFWSMTLDHHHVWLACLFLSRYLVCVRPLYLRLLSSKVCYLFATGRISGVSDGVDDDSRLFFQRFLDNPGMRLDEAVATARVDPKYLDEAWGENAPDEWVQWIGQVVIVRYGYDRGRHLAISCCLTHPGRIKYQAVLSPFLAELDGCAEAISRVAEEMVNEAAPNAPGIDQNLQRWLVSLRYKIQEELVRRGLIAEVQRARDTVKSVSAQLVAAFQTRLKPEDFIVPSTDDAVAAFLPVAAAVGQGVAATAPDDDAEVGQEEVDVAALRRIDAGRAARASDLVNHLILKSAANSPERLDEWNTLFAGHAEMAMFNLNSLPGIFRNRPWHFADAEAKNWYLTAQKGTNMTRSAAQLNTAYARQLAGISQTLDVSRRNSFERFNETRRANRANHSDQPLFTSPQSFGRVMRELAEHTGRRHSKSHGAGFFVLYCLGCGESALGTENSAHQCETVNRICESRGEQPSKQKAAEYGIERNRLLHVRDLLENPLQGREAWKRATADQLSSQVDQADDRAQDAVAATLREEVERLWQSHLAEEAAMNQVYSPSTHFAAQHLHAHHQQIPYWVKAWFIPGTALIEQVHVARFENIVHNVFIPSFSPNTSTLFAQLLDGMSCSSRDSQSTMTVGRDLGILWWSSRSFGIDCILKGNIALQTMVCDGRVPCAEIRVGVPRVRTPQHKCANRPKGTSERMKFIEGTTFDSFPNLPLLLRRRLIWGAAWDCRISYDVLSFQAIRDPLEDEGDVDDDDMGMYDD